MKKLVSAVFMIFVVIFDSYAGNTQNEIQSFSNSGVGAGSTYSYYYGRPYGMEVAENVFFLLMDVLLYGGVKSWDQRKLWLENPAPKFNLYSSFRSGIASGPRDNSVLCYDICPGVKFTPYWFTGLDFGFAFSHYAPSFRIGWNNRFILPVWSYVLPYIETSVGSSPDYDFYVRGGIGADIMRTEVSCGIDVFPGRFAMFYVGVGWKFGR